MLKFTSQQISDWVRYERVRAKGTYNMFDTRARQATGLDRDRFLFVLKNYSKLKDAVQKGQDA